MSENKPIHEWHLPPELLQKAIVNGALYGTVWLRREPDGTVTVLDPEPTE